MLIYHCKYPCVCLVSLAQRTVSLSCLSWLEHCPSPICASKCTRNKTRFRIILVSERSSLSYLTRELGVLDSLNCNNLRVISLWLCLTVFCIVSLQIDSTIVHSFSPRTCEKTQTNLVFIIILTEQPL